MSKKLIGMTLATTAALAFASAPVTSALAAGGKVNEVQCYGANACKGKSECKTATSGCSGHNACKGKGYITMSAEDCAKAGGRTSE